MKEKKRYAATVNFYVWAESEEDAIRQAEEIAAEQRRKNDDCCSVVDVVEHEFGKIGNIKNSLK